MRAGAGHDPPPTSRCHPIPRDSIGALVTYPWPGNEQELEDVVERAVMLMGAGELITAGDLPPGLQR
jgi:transcriptional regulator with PAS, ATPase and Fis domain